jgi:hypothetical protein
LAVLSELRLQFLLLGKLVENALSSSMETRLVRNLEALSSVVPSKKSNVQHSLSGGVVSVPREPG